LQLGFQREVLRKGVHYRIPVLRQPDFAKFSEDFLPFTDESSKTALSTPIHPNLHTDDQEFIISTTTKFYDERIYDKKESQDAISWSTKLI
jgi:dTDP-4-amino-4,6-dideoxygalactose transaminase